MLSIVRYLGSHRKAHDARLPTGRQANEDGSPQLASEQHVSVQRRAPSRSSQAPLRQSPSAAQGLPTSPSALPVTSKLQARTSVVPTRTGAQAIGVPFSGARSHSVEEQQGVEQRMSLVGARRTQRPEAQSTSDVQEA